MQVKSFLRMSIYLILSALIAVFIGGFFAVPDYPSQARDRENELEAWREAGTGKSVAEAAEYLNNPDAKTRSPSNSLWERTVEWRPWLLLVSTFAALFLARPNWKVAIAGFVPLMIVLVALHLLTAVVIASVGLILYVLVSSLISKAKA